MTSNIFLKLSYQLLPEEIEGPLLFSQDSELKKTWNTIFISKLLSNFVLDDLDNETIPSNVFHVYNFEGVTKTSDIYRWFTGYGKINVSWKNDNSAFVTIHEDEKLPEVVKLTKENNSEKFDIQTLRDYRNNSDMDTEEPSTPPQYRLHSPPNRTRRSSANLGKRPRPKSIDFVTDDVPKKRRKTNSGEEEASYCVIS